MFLACAPPAKTICWLLATLRSPEIWKMKMAFGSPRASSVSVLLTRTPVLHLCSPGVIVCPLRLPAMNSVVSGSGRRAAAVNADSMSEIAAVIFVGVGTA